MTRRFFWAFTARLTRAMSVTPSNLGAWSRTSRPPVGGARSETEKLLGARGVGLGDLDGAGHAARDLGGLLLQVVALAGLLAKDLARTGHAEALAGTGVRLVLRHLLFLYLVLGGLDRARPPPGRVVRTTDVVDQASISG